MQKKTHISVAIFLLGMAVAFMPTLDICHAAAPKEVRIGATAPLTGPAAESGVATKQGYITAIEEWKAKGGVYLKKYGKKLPIRIIIEDCQSKPEVGVSVGEKLITRDKVHFLMGDAIHSSVTMAVMELAPKYGIPLLSGQPVSTEIAKKVASNPDRYRTYWKGNWCSDALGKSLFHSYKYLMEKGLFKPKNKTIVFIVEDTDWGRSNAEVGGQLFTGIGWKQLTTETVALGYTDFYPQLTKLKAMDPDILVTSFTSLASGVAYTKQFHELGMKSSHFGIYYPTRPEYIPQAGKDSEFLPYIPFQFDPVNIPSHKKFGEKIKKRWGVSVTLDHAYGYDELNNALDAIERAGSLEPNAVVEALAKLDRRGILGRYFFDQKTHAILDGEDFLPVSAAQIQDGKKILFWPSAIAVGPYRKPPWLEE